MEATGAIAVEGVTKRYRGRRGVEALKGVSLTVAPGEIFGLLGRNGAGKTTLVKILLDIVRPTSGTASLLGVSPRSPKSRQAVGYLPEDHRFPDYRTGEQTMHFYGMLSGMGTADRRKRVAELLRLVRLADAAEQKVRSYSKGMKQRLGLAQALIHDPAILFLDEPTDGVDPVGRAEIRDVLIDLKTRGKTIFLNSHLLSEVETICDRVGILELGNLVREGSIDQLTRKEGVYNLSTIPTPDGETLDSLNRIAVSVRTNDGGLDVELTDASDIDRVVDLLRKRGISIRSLISKKDSLEQVFLEVVDEGDRIE